MVLSAIPAAAATLDPLVEVRYCGVIRDANGRLSRSSKVLSAFKRIHLCPVTKLPTGPCAGWSIDHILPLACGGCDAVWNLQWLPVQIKSAAGEFPKDRWERKIYCSNAAVVQK